MSFNGHKLLEGLLGKRYLSKINDDSLLKKIKQEKEDSDEELSTKVNGNKKDEPWQSEIRTLLDNGEAILENYVSDNETSLKWIVKHGIRLAITCTRCNIIEHDDEADGIIEHGMICDQTDVNESVDESTDEDSNINENSAFEIDVCELPRPFYPDTLQISLRKSLERNSCTLSDLTGDKQNWPLKYILGKNKMKRGGMCTFCGEIFLSTDYKKWVHECWMKDNEFNGFLINENEYDGFLDCSMDEAKKKNPDLLRFIINKTLETEDKASLCKQRLNAVHDRNWAYSIHDKLRRGELKEKAIIKDPDYCIRYLVDKTGILIAHICINCRRVFSPSINSSNRSRHISVCYLSKHKLITKQEGSEESCSNTRIDHKTSNVSNASRYKEESRLRKINLDYNINLEGPIVKTISSDILHPSIFYQPGMKAFCNRLMQIGFELGTQRGTTLPCLNNFFLTSKIQKQIFGLCVINEIGGTIVIELSGSLVTISLSIVEESMPKRIVCEVLIDQSKDSIDNAITALLTKMGIKIEMCNLFVNNQVKDLIRHDTFALQSTCFGDFLNHVVEQVFDDSISAQLSIKDRQELTSLKSTIDQIPSFIDFLLSKCSIPSDARLMLRSEVDGRWFSYASYVEKLLFVIKKYPVEVLESIGKLDNDIKVQMTKFFETATTQFKQLQAYIKLAQIFINNLEPCTISRRSTIHLVVLKFNFIREQLKTLSEQQDDTLFQQFCTIAINIMELAEENFLKKSHFIATLLAPGYRDNLKLYYDEEQILDYENELIQTLKSTDDIDSEVERYFEADVQSKIDPLEWWLKNEGLAPKISKLARRVFSIPATSITKTLPEHLSNTQIDETMRLRILFNWTLNSDLQAKKSTKKQ